MLLMNILIYFYYMLNYTYINSYKFKNISNLLTNYPVYVNNSWLPNNNSNNIIYNFTLFIV